MRTASRRRWIAGAAGLLVAVAAVLLLVRSGGERFHPPASEGELAGRLDRAIADALPAAHVPDAQAALVHDGRVVWSRAYGAADQRTRFRVGSVSKPVAALGLLRLARERGVALDRPLAIAGWPASAPVTLGQLLSHTAGLSVPGYLGLPPDRPVPSTRDEVEGRGEQPRLRQEAPPGRGYRYSGGGFTLAQLWAEQVSGESFAVAMRRRVLDPTGMRDSSFAATTTARAARGHDGSGSSSPDYRYAATAAAGLWSTATDLGRFVGLVASGDPLARQMRRAAPATDGAYGRGLELRTLADGTRMVWHPGVDRGWQALIAAFPERGWGLVVLTDGDGGGAVADAALRTLVR